MSDEAVRLCVKENNAAVRGQCALCGASTDPDIGPTLFVEGGWTEVCEECGWREAPFLQAMLTLAGGSMPMGLLASVEGDQAAFVGTVRELAQRLRPPRSPEPLPPGESAFGDDCEACQEVLEHLQTERLKDPSRVKLYHACSPMDLTKRGWGGRNVQVFWLAVREVPLPADGLMFIPTPCEHGPDHADAEASIQELFTEDELTELAKVVAANGGVLCAVEAHIPFPACATPTDLLGYDAHRRGWQAGTLTGGPTPVKVMAYCDLDGPPFGDQ